VNLLLGNNGTGKSTILRGLALAALAPLMSKSAGYVPYYMVRRGAKRAEIDAALLLHEQDLHKKVTGSSHATRSVSLGVRIQRERDNEYVEELHRAGSLINRMSDDKSPAFLIVGYGATRRVEEAANFSSNEQRKRRILRYQRVAGLFESHIALTPLAAWLPRMAVANKGRYVQVTKLIDKLLPEGSEFTGAQERGGDGEYLFRLNGVDVPFGALSDGYRAYIGWIADLLYHVCMGAPSGAKLVDNRGVVLVDEIDLHLHPEWQRSVISTISGALPNLQFVFSTHSPIVAGSVQKENVFVMESDKSGASTIAQLNESIYGLDAQQVLLSSYFGLDTTRAPGAVDELQELSKQLTPGRSDVALSMMRKLAGNSHVNGSARASMLPKKRARLAVKRK
jgi:predicted ATP-binding protein involved in virulence